MTNYITGLNQLLVEHTKAVPQAIIYGQNINSGTFISGLSRNLAADETSSIVNTPNCEYSACGIGFGVMMNGAHAIYYAKQLDFMLLGMDHFVNTLNFIKVTADQSKLGSFTIVLIVCDQGMQGPQSSFNSFGDMCSLARFSGFPLTNKKQTDLVLRKQLTAPGFRIVALSQRMFRDELLDLDVLDATADANVFQYSEGDDATIVCFNFSLPQGHQLRHMLQEQGKTAAVFSVGYMEQYDWTSIRRSVERTKRLVVIDDSKSVHLAGHGLISDLLESGLSFQPTVVRRQSVDWGMTDDAMAIDYSSLLSRLNLRS
jgi:pyruvate dehydrogenase E1 component beta subunit